MNKFKILIIGGAVIAVVGIIAMIYVVAFKNPTANISSVTEDSLHTPGIVYTNEEFGYRVILPESWAGYKVSQTETNTMFYIPADGMYKDLGYKYGAILYVAAIPMDEVRRQEQICKTPDSNRYWAECAAVTESIGGNNAYRFYTRFADDYMTGHEDEGKAVQKSIQFFDISQTPPNRTLRSVQKYFVYEFAYPTNTFKPEYAEDIALPYNSEAQAYGELSLYHEIPMQYCGASGECVPITIDMKVGAVALNDPIDTIKRSAIGTQLITKTFGKNTALVLAQGAEGEGINYYFIETPNKKVVMIYHRYINEQVVQNYKNQKDFIPYSEQIKIMENIIKSIHFSN